jgi:hypothetical protein
MAVDHNRPLPVSPERLKAVAAMLFPDRIWHGDDRYCPEVYQIALLGEQVEWQQQTAFFLSEAYDIYNARFR